MHVIDIRYYGIYSITATMKCVVFCDWLLSLTENKVYDAFCILSTVSKRLILVTLQHSYLLLLYSHFVHEKSQAQRG